MIKDSKTIIFLGDSLTEWFDWQARFPEYKIKNLGIAGETADGLLSHLDRALSSMENPDYIFIMTGINNIAMEDYNIIGTYREILNKISSSKDSVIVVQSLLPIVLPWINSTMIKDINRSLKELSKEFKAEYLDIFSHYIDSTGNPIKEYLLDDGVHLSDEGYHVWSKAVEDFFNL